MIISNILFSRRIVRRVENGRLKMITNGSRSHTWQWIVALTAFSIFAYPFSASASQAEVILELFAGGYSSLSNSGPAIPMKRITPPHPPYLSPEGIIVRQDTLVYGANLKLAIFGWLYPSLGFRFAQQEVTIRYGDRRGPAGNTFSEDHWISLDASSTTTFAWTTIGVEVNVPPRTETWRSFIFGTGASLIYAEDRIHPASKYIDHYERWSKSPILFNQPPTRVEFHHEEKAFDNFSSSGFGLGWYLLSGIAFHLSQKLSLALEIQANFGTVELHSRNSSITNRLMFDSTTIGITSSYQFY